MCGIAGIVNLRAELPPPGRDALEAMVAALHHRGPDERGIYRDPHAGLGHARLSIIDLATGQQPLVDDESGLALVYNGEIFNYVELRAELASLGHCFRTQSDTEVLLVAWKEWGERALERLDGQWAFALWDARARRLVLCRDRLGVRPIHIAERDGRVSFASEVKALFAGDPALPRAFDPLGIQQTFTFWAALAPRSVFAGVTELEAGHVRTYEAGRVVDRAYWTPRFVPDGAPTVSESTEAVLGALERATSLRMLRADVPVGSYLSGGLDSSLVAALALRAKGPGFHTFSIRFDDAEYDETRYQREMAARLGSEHHELVVTARDIARAFPDVVRHAERPLLRTAPAPLFLLSRAVEQAGIKVVLTGEGADEVFAGYDLFREGKLRRFWARQPESRTRPRLLERLYPYLARSPVRARGLAQQFFGQDLASYREPGFAHQTRWRTTSALLRLLAPELRASLEVDPVGELLASLPPELAHWSPLAADQYLEMRTLLSSYLLSSQGDRMLMAHSVEGRFPFLDKDVVDLGGRLPDAHKLAVLDEKHVLKRAANGLVPHSVVARKKQPYRAPDAAAFAGADAPDWVEWAMDKTVVRDAGVFDPAVVARLRDKLRTRGDQPFSNTDNMAVVGVLSTQLLSEELLRKTPRPRHMELRTNIDRTTP